MATKSKKSAVNFKGRTFEVSSAQKAAYNRLPANLKKNFNAPGARVISVAQLTALRKAYSTVMCPW